MKYENNNTTSLKISKELKAVGFKKKVKYYWNEPSPDAYEEISLIKLSYTPEDNQLYKFYLAPNIIELLNEFEKIEIKKENKRYSVKAYPFDYVNDRSLVNALAKLWILFKKEKLI